MNERCDDSGRPFTRYAATSITLSRTRCEFDLRACIDASFPRLMRERNARNAAH